MKKAFWEDDGPLSVGLIVLSKVCRVGEIGRNVVNTSTGEVLFGFMICFESSEIIRPGSEEVANEKREELIHRLQEWHYRGDGK